ncbi:phycocyanin alpha phycocyanobilin lyase [Halorientalis sp. IM1011]|uniref:HEAT repeat domain-containing protein n=1 Tax=Halorientalis sp. IM1011 TaxID=1932360 RepID=UPI00097CD692|nr:HEAT repeat domain-containing protein [Halorientalis sp. IM1011]AQL43085.1 phycocyanin alpha phycocyanobilin lyase [Halorientalis sp. IM1011]
MSLYQLERDGEVEGLKSVLRTSENPEVRARAAEILGDFDAETLEGHDAVTPLVDLAQSAESDRVTAAAIDALNQLGTDAMEALIAEMAGLNLNEDQQADWAKAKAFAKALSSDVPELRMAAANALGELGKTDVLPTLLESLDDPDPRVRARVARACGRLEDARATDALIERLSDPKAEVRREAAEALGAIGNRQALTALLDMFDDERGPIRRIAVGAMGNFGDARPVEGLVSALSDDDASVRRAAVYSIIELLSNVPTDQSHEIRETVVEQLNRTDDRSVLVPMIDILEESTQNRQRRNTAWLLGRVADEDSAGYGRIVEALVETLEDDDQMTAQFAATSLAEIGGTRVETRLLDVVDDTSYAESVRAQAVFTLGKVGGERSRKRLDDLIDTTESEQLRKKAFSAISKLGGRGVQ